MTPVDLETRTTDFALRIVKLFSALPNTTEAQVLGETTSSQWDVSRCALSRSETSQSNLDFINKIEGALQDLDETCYWLELIEKSGIMSGRRLASLRAEAVELTKILVTVVKRGKEKVK